MERALELWGDESALISASSALLSGPSTTDEAACSTPTSPQSRVKSSFRDFEF